jgi:ribosomal protein S18 acetylase RimI-like enzyme
MSVTIRDFRDDERNVIAALQIDSWLATYGHMASADVLAGTLQESIALEWESASFVGRDFALVAAAEDGAVIGFITVLDKASHAFIDHLHVRQTFHRSGVGRQLLLAASSRILQQGHSKMQLTVFSQNSRARAFYAAFGGVEIEEYDDDDILGTKQKSWVVEWNGNIPRAT